MVLPLSGDEEADFAMIAGELVKEPAVEIEPSVMKTREGVYEIYLYYRDGMNGFERGRT